jgi:hypothetical protein
VSLSQVAGTTVNRVQQLTGGATFSTDTPTAAAIVRGTRYVVTVKTLPISQPLRLVFPRLLAGHPDLLVGEVVYIDAGGRWQDRAWQNADSGEVYDTYDRLGDAYPEVAVALYEDETGALWRARALLDPDTQQAFDTYEELGRAVDQIPTSDQGAASVAAAPLEQVPSGSITAGVVVEGRVGLVPKRAGQAGVDLTPGQAGAVTNGATAQSPLTPQGFRLFDQSTQDLHDVQAALTTAALADQVVAEFAATMGLVPPSTPPPPPGAPPPGGGGAGPSAGGASLLGAVSLVLEPEVAGVTTSAPRTTGSATPGGAGTTTNPGSPPITAGGSTAPRSAQFPAGGGGGEQSPLVVPTHTSTPHRSSGPAAADTPTPTLSPTVTDTPAATGSPTSTPTPTATSTPTVTPTATNTPIQGGGSCVNSNSAAVFWLGGSGLWSDPTHWSSGAVPGALNDVCITNAGVTVNFEDTSTVLSLHNVATLHFVGGSLTITGTGQSEAGPLSLGGGNLTTNGTLDVPAGDTLTWTGGTLSGSGVVRVESAATLVLSGTGNRFLVDATVMNLGTMNWSDGGQLLVSGTGTVNNTAGGSLNFQADASLVANGGQPSLVNAGSLTKVAGAGTTTISVPLNGSGPVRAQSGTLDLINGGKLGSGTSFGGSGTVRLNGGTFTLSALSTITVTKLTLEQGTLTGPGTLDVLDGGTLTWTGGDMAGTGRTLVESGGSLLLSGTGNRFLVDRILDNLGTITWTNGGQLLVSGAGTLRNEVGGLVDLQAGNLSLTANGGSPSIVNLGTLQKLGDGGVATISVPLTTSGTTTVSGTIIDLTGGGTFNPGAVFTGSSGGLTQLDSGTFKVNGTVTARNITVASGEVSGSGTLEVPAGSTLTWTGGTMSGVDGITHISGSLMLSGTGNRFLVDRALQNAGRITWTDGGQLLMSGAGQVVNQVNASMAFSADATIANNGGSPSIQNAGTITKLAGSGTTTLGVPLTNARGAVIAASTGRFDFGNLVNSGTLAPTATQSTAVSNVRGTFSQTSTGTLDLKLGPATAGPCTTSDTLAITGAATLNGTLTVTTLGCPPGANTTYTVLTFASLTGQFATVTPPFSAQYLPTSVIVAVV